MAGVRAKPQPSGRYQASFVTMDGQRKFFVGTRSRPETLRMAQRFEAQTLARHATPQMTLGVYGRTREERLHHVVEQVATVLQGETQRATSVHRVDTAEKTKAVNTQTRSVYSSAHPMEAAGIEPASESLQLQPLHMLFRGQLHTLPTSPVGQGECLPGLVSPTPPPGVGGWRLSHIVTPYTTTVGE